MPSYRSSGSVLSAFSHRSALSFASAWSVASSGSCLSIASAGSLLSIGSAGSVLSFGAAGGFAGKAPDPGHVTAVARTLAIGAVLAATVQALATTPPRSRSEVR